MKSEGKVTCTTVVLLREIFLSFFSTVCSFTSVESDGVNISFSEGNMPLLNGAGKRQHRRNSPPSLFVKEGKGKIAERRFGMRWKF